MTIAIAFHGSGFRSFKEFYTLCVLPHWRNAFPNLVSYTRFVELMPWSLMLLCCFVHSRKGEVTGIAFIDSTPIEVCHPCRVHAYKVFKGLVKWGKNEARLAFWLQVTPDYQRQRRIACLQINSCQHASIVSLCPI